MKRQIIGTIILIALILSLSTINSFAVGSFSVTSSRTLTEGGTSSITISANGCGGKFTISSSNSSVVSVSSSSMWVESGSSSVTITAKKAGTATITVTASDVASTDGSTEITGSKTCTVTVNAKTTSNSGVSSSGGSTSNKNNTTKEEKEKSKDSTLSALSVNEGTITPEFSKDVKEYALTIPYEISEINVTATPTDSKAKVAVEGNKDLKEGENTVTVKVTAEDGSTSNYVIKVTRKRVPIALKSLVIKYENQNGELIELPLNPVFAFDKLEYTLEDLEYWVEKLSIEAVSNLDGATIDIQGAENLQVGENTITITLKIAAEDVKEGEEPKEETITYTIKVNKKEEPTLIAKISNWFKGIFGGVSSWYGEHQEQVILGALGICIIALLGLSIYIVVDYNKYKDVIAKLKKVNEINENQNIAEEIYQKNNPEILENLGKKSDNDDNAKGGKHF